MVRGEAGLSRVCGQERDLDNGRQSLGTPLGCKRLCALVDKTRVNPRRVRRRRKEEEGGEEEEAVSTRSTVINTRSSLLCTIESKGCPWQQRTRAVIFVRSVTGDMR
jgi:hypothetical protein